MRAERERERRGGGGKERNCACLRVCVSVRKVIACHALLCTWLLAHAEIEINVNERGPCWLLFGSGQFSWRVDHNNISAPKCFPYYWPYVRVLPITGKLSRKVTYWAVRCKTTLTKISLATFGYHIDQMIWSEIQNKQCAQSIWCINIRLTLFLGHL